MRSFVFSLLIVALVATLPKAQTSTSDKLTVYVVDVEGGKVKALDVLMALLPRPVQIAVLDPQIQKGEAAQRLNGRPEKCRPLAASEALLLGLAARNNLRVNAKARIVDKNPAVDFADVHRGHHPLLDRPHRAL